LLQNIAQKFLFKCDGCLLAITIIGAILWENQAQTPEKWKDVYEQFKYYADKAPAGEDYKGESKTIFAAIKLSLEYGQEESERVGMENILRTLSLFKEIQMSGSPAIVVHLAWSYLQPQGNINHFKMLLNCLIARNLVVKYQYSFSDRSAWEFQEFELPQMVQEYVSMKLQPIDMCNVLEMDNQELLTGRKKKIEKYILLATFLPIWKTRHTNLEFALSLGQFYYAYWKPHELFTLLGTKDENVIFFASQPHKVTQENVNALFDLVNSDKIQAWPAACILFQLVDHFHGDYIFQHIKIQGLIRNLKHYWKIETMDGCNFQTIALNLAKYRTFAKQFAIDEDLMEIVTNIVIQNCLEYSDSTSFLFTLSQHKNVRNIFYQNYTKISMKNMLKQISSKWIHERKLVHEKKLVQPNVYYLLDLPLQYEDLAIQIIDEGGDDIVLGIFDYFFTNESTSEYIIKLLFSTLEGLAKRKEGEAIIIKHVHLLLRCFFCVYDFGMYVSKLVQHKGIAQALITQERVELLVGALEQGKVAVVPLVLQCLFFENEEFACKVIARGGWRMMTKGMQLMSSCDMFQFSLMHIAREMASKGEIQELLMEVINEDNSEYCDSCLELLKILVTYHIDIMREEFIAKGGIQFLLACLASSNHYKKYDIITSGLLQKVARDVKGAEEMMAHNGIQVFVQLLVVDLNDDNVMSYVYIENIVDIIKPLIKGLEDPMKLLMSSIDDIDVLKIHETLLHLYGTGLSFLPETLDVDRKIANKLLNSLQDVIYLNKDVHEDGYINDCNIVNVLIKLSKHVEIASQVMAKEGILEGFVIQLSKGNLNRYTIKLLEVVLQHENVATQVVHQRPSFIKELLHMFPMERFSTFKYERLYSVASLLFTLAKHGGVFIEFIVNNDGIQFFLNAASRQNWIGRCDVIKVLHIMAKAKNYALRIEKAGGSKMLLRAISCYLQYVHDKHLETVDIGFIMEYEDECLVMCCLKTLSRLVRHEEIAKQISTTRGKSQECGIIALVDVMQTASQLWSSITLVFHEIVVTERHMQIKGYILTILSKLASMLVLMAKLHPDISRKVNEDVLKGIFQLEGMVIDEHQTLKETLQDLLDIKKFHVKTWNCQQLRSKTIDI
jgi:hypothetical protein